MVVPGGSTWKANQAGGIVVFRRDGSIRCRFQTGDAGNVWANTAGPDGYPDGVYSSPALGDVDGDTYPDIVFGAWDLRVHALDRNCNEISGFPVNVEDSTWGSPALYDSDDDGRLEIFIGSDQFAGGFINWSGGEMRALDWANGSVRELWKRQVDDVIHSSPAIGDIDGDGRLEAVVGGGNYYNRGDGRKVFAWHVDDGSTVPGWPQSTNGPTNSVARARRRDRRRHPGSRDRQRRRDPPRVSAARVRSIGRDNCASSTARATRSTRRRSSPT